MINFLIDLWRAFKAAFRAARLSRRRLQGQSAGEQWRAILHAARLATLSDDELKRCATAWRGEACRRELERRGRS